MSVALGFIAMIIFVAAFFVALPSRDLRNTDYFRVSLCLFLASAVVAYFAGAAS